MKIEVLGVVTSDTEANYGGGAIRIFTGERPSDISPDTHVILKAWSLEMQGDTPVRVKCEKNKCDRCTTPDCGGGPPPPASVVGPPANPNIAVRKENADMSERQISYRTAAPLGPAFVQKWSTSNPPTAVTSITTAAYGWLRDNGETIDTDSIVFHVYAVVDPNAGNNSQNVLHQTTIAIPVKRFATPSES